MEDLPEHDEAHMNMLCKFPYSQILEDHILLCLSQYHVYLHGRLQLAMHMMVGGAREKGLQHVCELNH